MRNETTAGSGANNVFGGSAEQYGTKYSAKTAAYVVAEEIMVGVMVDFFRNRRFPAAPRVLEVGAGTGQSTARIEQRLGKANITDYKLVITEYNEEMISTSRKLATEAVLAGKDSVVKTPQLLVSADHLPFSDRTFDVVYASMVIHWITEP